MSKTMIFVFCLFLFTCSSPVYCGTIQVRVVAEGTAVQGAKVFTAHSVTMRGNEAPSLIPCGETDASGSIDVTVEPLFASGVTIRPAIMAFRDGFAVGIAGCAVEDEHSAVTIELKRPVIITGRVTDSAGLPVAGAVITPMFEIARDREISDVPVLAEFPGTCATSGDDGGFAIRSVPPGMCVAVVVVAEGYGKCRWEDMCAGQRDFPLTLVPEGRISGRIRIDDNGLSPAGARVVLRDYRHSVSPPLYTAVSNHDGYYSIDGIVPGMYMLEASFPAVDSDPPPVAARRLSGIEVFEDSTVTAPDMLFETGCLVSGRVAVAGTGHPVAHIAMSAHPANAPTQTVPTDEQGRYRFRCPSGSIVITPEILTPFGRMEPHHHRIDAVSGESVGDINFDIDRTCAVILRPVSPDGEPYSGAMIGSFHFPWRSRIPLTAYEPNETRRTFGAIDRKKRLRGYVTTEIRDNTILDIPLKPYDTVTITGRAVDCNGETLPWAHINVQSFRYCTPQGKTRLEDCNCAVSDGRGEFTIDGVVAGDRHVVKASLNGYCSPAPVHVDSSAAGVHDLGDIVFERKRGTLSGRVRDNRGTPVSGAEVQASYGDITARGTVETAITDSRGRFTIEGVPDTLRQFLVTHRSYSEYVERNVPTDKTLFPILMRRDRWIDGRVVNADGDPVAGARIFPTFYRFGYSHHDGVTTDSEGYFRLEDLAALAEELEVYHEDLSHGSFVYNYIPTGGTHELVLPKTDAHIEGTLLDDAGEPLIGWTFGLPARYYPDGPDGCTLWHTSEPCRTDSAGYFAIDRLLPGEYEVVFNNAAYDLFFAETLIAGYGDDASMVVATDIQPRAGRFCPVGGSEPEPRKTYTVRDCKISRWIGGTAFDPESPTQPLTVLTFFDGGDDDSIAALRFVRALVREFGPKGVAFAGIHPYTADVGAVTEIIRRHGIDWPVAIDGAPVSDSATGPTHEACDVSDCTDVCILRRDGSLITVNNLNGIERKLIALLGEGWEE